MREAMFYKHFDDMVVCHLCPNKCLIKEGEFGICKTRQVMEGKLYATSFGKVAGIQIDPIEKKPLAHWHSGSQILSVGSFGCNLHCPYCQNHELVNGSEHAIMMTPEAVVAQAVANNLDAIAFTYNEPTVNYEMVYETAVEAKKQGLYTVLVTNGFINQEPLLYLLPYIDAMNVDIKSYDDSKFKHMCGGRLKPVFEMVKTSLQFAHVELTMLLVPELYDDMNQMDGFFRYISIEYGDLPIHLSRYFPRYNHITAPTRVEWMLEVQKLAQKYFTYVYLGNVF